MMAEQHSWRTHQNLTENPPPASHNPLAHHENPTSTSEIPCDYCGTNLLSAQGGGRIPPPLYHSCQHRFCVLCLRSGRIDPQNPIGCPQCNLFTTINTTSPPPPFHPSHPNRPTIPIRHPSGNTTNILFGYNQNSALMPPSGLPRTLSDSSTNLSVDLFGSLLRSNSQTCGTLGTTDSGTIDNTLNWSPTPTFGGSAMGGSAMSAASPLPGLTGLFHNIQLSGLPPLGARGGGNENRQPVPDNQWSNWDSSLDSHANRRPSATHLFTSQPPPAVPTSAQSSLWPPTLLESSSKSPNKSLHTTQDLQTAISNAGVSNNCTNCLPGHPAILRCVECAEMLCVECVRAHSRVRMTRNHRLVSPESSDQSAASGKAAWRKQLTGENREDHHTASSGSTGSMPASPALLSPQQRSVHGPPPIGSRFPAAMAAETASSAERQHAPARENTCAEHNEEQLVLECGLCATRLCVHCIHLHDTAHKLQPISSVPFNQLHSQLLGQAKQVHKDMEESAEAVDRMNERVEARVLSVANEVRAVLHLHMSALEERKRELLQLLDNVRLQKIDALAKQRTDIHRKMHTLKMAVEKHNGSLESLVNALQQCEYHSAFVQQPFEADNLSFTQPDNELIKSVRQLGAIKTCAYAGQCTVLGEAYKRAMRHRQTILVVQTKDHAGESLTIGGEQIYALLYVPNSRQPKQMPVIDKENGTYFLSFVPEMDGDYTVTILLRGHPIQGSPFNVHVRRGRDYTQIGTQPLFSFGSEGSGDGQLCRPWGVCIDRQGRVVIGDRSNNRVQVFDRDGRFLMKFGNRGTRPGQFDRPAGIAVNSKNNFVIADKDNHRVQVFTDQGMYVFKFGEKGRGTGQFNYPWDIAISQEDNIAVSDTRNHRIQLFTPTGQFLRKFGFDNSVFFKHLDTPRGLSFMADGQLLCSDFNNHRLVVMMTSMATGADNMKFIGREGTCAEWLGVFLRPQGIEIDQEGHVLVTDSRNDRIQVFTPELQPLCAFGREPGATDESPKLFDRPVDVAVALDGRVYVVDLGHNCVHVF